MNTDEILAKLAHEETDFWSDIVGLHNVGYAAAIDEDAVDVLKGIRDRLFNTVIAERLSLPGQYVELLQSIFCSIGWCSYGTSPRGCWIEHDLDADKLVNAFEAHMTRKWADDPYAPAPAPDQTVGRGSD